MECSEIISNNQRIKCPERLFLSIFFLFVLNTIVGQTVLKNPLTSNPSGTTTNNLPKQFSNIPYNITSEKNRVDNAPMALILSGDGGWFRFEQAIADKLGAYGIPTIGIDTRKYFWSRKTPEKTASDIADILIYYGNVWGKTGFVLIGYSQGAEIIPFLITLFPVNTKMKVVSAVLLSPDKTTDFEIHISNMLDLGNRQNTYDVIEEIKKLEKINTICIYGIDEKSSIPGLLKGTPVKFVFIPGDHHYHGNSTLIVKVMKDNNAF